MKPREIDALVEENVFGRDASGKALLHRALNDTQFGSTCGFSKDVFDKCWDDPRWWGHCSVQRAVDFYLPRYSAEIGSAWLLVEKMRERGWWFKIETGLKGAPWASFIGDTSSGHSHHDPAPMAICRAALRALGVEVTT